MPQAGKKRTQKGQQFAAMLQSGSAKTKLEAQIDALILIADYLAWHEARKALHALKKNIPRKPSARIGV